MRDKRHRELLTDTEYLVIVGLTLIAIMAWMQVEQYGKAASPQSGSTTIGIDESQTNHKESDRS